MVWAVRPEVRQGRALGSNVPLRRGLASLPALACGVGGKGPGLSSSSTCFATTAECSTVWLGSPLGELIAARAFPAVTVPLLTTQRVLGNHNLWRSAAGRAAAAAREALAQGASALQGVEAEHSHAGDSSVSAPLGTLRPRLDSLPECGEVSGPHRQACGSSCCTSRLRRVMDIPPTAGPALYGPGWELRCGPLCLLWRWIAAPLRSEKPAG